MKHFWFKIFLVFFLFVGLLLIPATVNGQRTLAQQITPGPTDVFITVTYSEQINIRSGPGTVLYDIIGNLQPGDTAIALGVSPGRDWIMIAFPGAPGGTGWVHTSLVSLSPGNLQILEPPPTSTPLTTPTIDSTLMAAFVFEPTSTRLPTFTPPPEIVIPTFGEENVDSQELSFPFGAILLGLGIPGLFGYVISSYMRRR